MIPKECRIILVLSGKGGVGKSTLSLQLALSIGQESGKKTGLLDIDLCGPSIPTMVGLEGHSVRRNGDHWTPVPTSSSNLSVMSIGFLLDSKDSAVIWRGPKKNALIKQFLNDVDWTGIDYLVIDTPPGTSDEHISLVEGLKEMALKQSSGSEQNGTTAPSVGAPPPSVGALPPSVGAVLVTTPQGLSLADVRREIGFCRKAGVRMIGVIENMSGYICPHCSDCTDIFSSGGGQSLAKLADIPLLTTLPIDPKLAEAMDKGDNFLDTFPDSTAAAKLREMVKTSIFGEK